MTAKLDMLIRASRPLELKLAQASTGEFTGYASLFGGEPDAYGDVIAPGAFSASLAAHDQAGTTPVMLWSHDPASPVGRWETIVEDVRGLHVAGRLNLQTDRGREAHAHLQAGDVNGLSIGYRVPPGGSTVNNDGSVTLKEIDLLEISIVAIPAASRARITAVKHLGSQVELERLLHANGLPRGAAAKLAAGGFPALAGRHGDAELQSLNDQIKAAFASLARMKKD